MRRYQDTGRIWLAASLLCFALACGKAPLPEVQPEEPVEVSFTVGTDDDAATRASSGENGTVGKGKSIDKLIYAVYDSQGNLLEKFGAAEADRENGIGVGQSVVKKGDDGSFSLNLTLVRGQEYKVVFWAQNSASKVFDTMEGLDRVRILYDGAVNNDDENRDAFCKAEIFTATESGTRKVTLRRPFAQINLGMEAEEYEKLLNSWGWTDEASTPLTVELSVGPVAKEFNVVDNSVNGSEDNTREAVFAAAVPLEESLFVHVSKKPQTDAPAADEETEYKWLSMCYILVADATEGASTYSSELSSLSYTLRCGDEFKKLVFLPGKKEGFTVPVQRNWSTNLLVSMQDVLDICGEGEEVNNESI